MAVEIRVLGRVDAIVDGRSLPLGGAKQRAVLAMLALRANRAVATDVLIDGLWGERPPASAAKNVQLYVSQLRKALASDESGSSIVTHGRGYELKLPDDGVDAGRLEALIAEHPTHERYHAQRMLALYRAGRQSEAVDGYRAAHRTLAAEIGIEPGPELRRLQEQILAHDPALDARPPPELPRQLEGGSPLLAGRDRELRWLRKRWAEAEEGRTRVALVSGSPGIGKTRLAAELAAAVQPEGTVLYAAGSGSPDAAHEAI